MPRRNVAQWGRDGFSEVREVTISESDLKFITQHFGVDDSDRTAAPAIKDFLEAIGSRYLRWSEQVEGAPTNAKQTVALREIARAEDRLVQVLASLDYASEARVLEKLGASSGQFARSLMRLEWLKTDLIELRTATRKALHESSSGRGPRPRLTLQQIILEIAEFYEDISGKPFTHTPRVKTNYDGVPHSSGGQVVLKFFQIADASLPPQTINSAIATVVKDRHSRQETARSNGPEQTS